LNGGMDRFSDQLEIQSSRCGMSWSAGKPVLVSRNGSLRGIRPWWRSRRVDLSRFTSILMLALAWACVQHSRGRAKVISVSVPFFSPKGGYVTAPDRFHTFRIPGMVVAPDKSVLAFAEARRGNGSDPRGDENAPIDVVMRRSTDNGRTWQPMVVMFRAGPRTDQSFLARAAQGSS